MTPAKNVSQVQDPGLQRGSHTPLAVSDELRIIGEKRLACSARLVGDGSDNVAVMSKCGQLFVQLADVGRCEAIFILRDMLDRIIFDSSAVAHRDQNVQALGYTHQGCESSEETTGEHFENRDAAIRIRSTRA